MESKNLTEETRSEEEQRAERALSGRSLAALNRTAVREEPRGLCALRS